MKSNDPEVLTRRDFEGKARRKVYENFVVSDEDLSHIKLPQETIFKDGRFERCNLDFAVIEKATWENVHWHGVSFKHGSLRNSTFAGCVWRSVMVEWSNFRSVALENIRLIDPVRLWFCAVDVDFYPVRHVVRQTGYIRSPQPFSVIQKTRKAKLAELERAKQTAEAQAREAEARRQFESLEQLPTSELLRLFNTSPDDDRVAKILDQRIA